MSTNMKNNNGLQNGNGQYTFQFLRKERPRLAVTIGPLL